MHPHRNRVEAQRREQGAGLVEYALLLAMIAIVCFSAVSFFGAQSSGGFGHSTSCISSAYNGEALNSDCE